MLYYFAKGNALLLYKVLITELNAYVISLHSLI